MSVNSIVGPSDMYDCAVSAFGPRETWPSELRVAFEMCLRSRVPSAVFWGPDYRLLYNDKTMPMLGNQHPHAFGQPAASVWTASWSVLEPLLNEVMSTGREVSGVDRRFGVDSQGNQTRSYYSQSLLPIPSEDGRILGVLGHGRETTAALASERGLREERERLAIMFGQAPGFFALLQGPDHVIAFINSAGVDLIGRRDVLGRPAREALPEIEGQGFIEMLDEAYASGKAVNGTALPAKLQRTPGQDAEVRYVDFVFQPIQDSGGVSIVVQGMDVTERVKATEAVVESDGRFRLIAERAPVMIWMSDKDGHCLYLNKSLREFWGIAEDQVIGFDWTPTIHPDDLGPLWEPWLAGMKSRAGFSVEARYRRADGVYRILNTTAQPRFDAAGSFTGMIGVNVDVTETRKIEVALREETHLLEVLNHAGTAIAAELDLETVVQLVTDAGVQVTGAEFGAFFYNVTNDAGESYMLYSLSGASRESFANFAMPRATAIFKPTFDGAGIVRSDDILAHPLYGQSAPFKGMPPGHLPVRSYLAVPVTSRSGEVLGGLFFGHQEPGRFGRDDERLLSGLAAQGAIAIDNARLFQAAERENKQRAEAERRLTELNETLEGRVIAEIVERRQAEAALQQAQKMEAIGQLTGGVAHDFNNLLQVIAGNLQLLQRDVAGNDRAAKRVDNAIAGVNRGAKLASQLLAFGRRQALEPKVVNIGGLVSGMEEMLRRTLGEAVEVNIRVVDGLWNSFVDTSQMENAVLNLAINARDAMPKGGQLTVEAGNTSIDGTNSRSSPEVEPGEYVTIAVTDTGLGIPPEILPRVFEPFFSTKEETRGTGLGLSMVYGFVKQSGGHVTIESEVDRGTTVRLYLPREASAESVLAKPDSGPVQGGDETILVAEDDNGVRDTVVGMLEELGYKVLRATDAATALDLIEREPAIDLLFTDVVMPGELKSPELARIVRDRFPWIAILFTSGYAENSIVHGGKVDSGIELLPKPYTRDALARRVRAVLSNRSASIPRIGNLQTENAATSEEPQELRILFVEDEVLIRMNATDLLRDLGHIVMEAGTVEEALGVLATMSIDILITDVGLGRSSGVELAHRAREIQPEVSVVFATGAADSLSTLGLARSVVLAKPYDEAAIAQAIARLQA